MPSITKKVPNKIPVYTNQCIVYSFEALVVIMPFFCPGFHAWKYDTEPYCKLLWMRCHGISYIFQA